MVLSVKFATPRQPEDITSVMTTVEPGYISVQPRAAAFAEDPAVAQQAQQTSIQSVERALAILECLANAEHEIRLRDVAMQCGINSSTCHHLLNTLVRRGYVSRTATGLGYQLGSRAWQLGKSAAGNRGWLEHFLPLARHVRDVTGEATVVAGLCEGRLTQLLRLDTSLSRTLVPCHKNISRAAHAVAVGKAILAWLPEPSIARVIADQGLDSLTPHTLCTLGELANSLRQARRHGFALDDEEFLPGIVSMGCVLRGPTGEVLGAIGCSLSRTRATDHRLMDLHAILKDASLSLPRLLGA